MVMKYRSAHEPVDYFRQRQERKKLTNYLSTGNFKKVAGEKVVTISTERKRMVLCGISLVFLLIGLYFVLF